MIAGLAVSNLAWNQDEEPAALKILRELGFTGIEIAPTKIWPDWAGVDAAAASAVARRLTDEGFAVPALQAILFGLPALKIFADAQTQALTLEHLSRVADLGAALGADCLVYGAPSSRDRGTLDDAAAFEKAVAFFRQVGSVCLARGVCLGIEPIPSAYGGTFATSWREVLALVDAVRSPAVRLHLDVGCAYLGGDDPVAVVASSAPQAVHFHVSEPHLGPLASPVLDHEAIGRALRRARYQRWVSVEMKRDPDGIDGLRRAASAVAGWYGRKAA